MRLTGTALCALMACALVVCIIGPCSAERTVQWTAPQTAALHWGDSHFRGAYELVCVNLPKINETGKVGERFVGLDLYDKGTLKERLVLTEGEAYVYDNELRITVLEIHAPEKTFESEVYDPYALVRTELRGHPAISITLSTDRRSYTPPRGPAPESEKRIVLTVKVKNSGRADLYACHIDVNTDGLAVLSGQTSLDVDVLPMEKEVVHTLVLALPYPKTLNESITTRHFTVSASARGEGLKGRVYSANASHIIDVLPMWTPNDVRFTKRCYPTWVRLNDTVGVRVYIENDGMYPIEARVRDTLPKGMELLDVSTKLLDVSTKLPEVCTKGASARGDEVWWNVSLAPDESAELTYRMRVQSAVLHAHPTPTPQAPQPTPPSDVPPEVYRRIRASQGAPHSTPSSITITLPPARATIVLAGTEHALSSDGPSIRLYAPNVSVHKEVSTTHPTVGENVSVSVSTRVVWDMRAKVVVHDSLPEGAVLVCGTLSDSAIMKKGQERTLTYTVRFVRAGEYVLPPVRVEFENLQGYHATVLSEPVHITVERPVPASSPTSSSTPRAKEKETSGGFEVLLCVCSILLVVLTRR